MAETVLKLGVDTSDVKTAKADLDQLTEAGKRTETAAAGLGAGLAKVDAAAAGAGKAVSAIGAATEGAATALHRTQGATNALAGALGAVDAKIGFTAASVGKVGGAAAEAAESFLAIGSAASVAAASIADQGQAASTAAANNEKAASALRTLEDAAVKTLQAQANLGRATLAAAQAQAQLTALQAKAGASQDAIAAAAVKAESAQAQLAAATIGTARAQEAGATAAKAYKDALNATDAVTKKVGVSAGQTAAAMRQLPAQFTDIVTGLQAGQSPFTVLLQQGGQIKDSFGGVGNALKSVGSLISPTVAVIGSAAAVIATLGLAYQQGAAETDAYRKALVLSGNAAGTTVDQLASLAKAQSAVVGTQGAAAAALAALAATGNVASAGLGQAAEAAVRLARVGGPAVEETVKAFSALGKNPLQASQQLNESTNFLTVSLQAQIKALQETGQTAAAAALAQDAYGKASIDAAKKLEANLGTLQKAALATGDFFKSMWDKILNVGRESSVGDQIKNLEAQLAVAERAAGTELGGQAAYNDGEANLIREKIAALRELSGARDADAKAAADNAQAVNAAQKLSGIVDQFKSPGEKLKQAKEEFNNLRKAAGDTGDAIGLSAKALDAGFNRMVASSAAASLGVAAALARISAQARLAGADLETTVKRLESAAAIKDTARTNPLAGLQDQIKLIQDVSAARLADSKVQEGLLAQSLKQERGKIDNAAGIIAAEAAVQLQKKKTAAIVEETEAAATLATKKHEAAIRDLMRALREEGEVQIEALAQQESQQTVAAQRAVQDYVQGIQESIEATRLELSLAGQTEQARSIAIAQFQVELALRKQLADISRTQFAGDVDQASRARQEAIDKATAASESAKANILTKAAADAAKAADEAFKATYTNISDGLAEAIIGGGRSGADYIKNLFRQMVLTPVVKALIAPIVGSLAGAVSAAEGGPGSVTGSLSGLFSNLQGGISSSIQSAFSKLAESGIGQKFGLSTVSEDAAGNIFASSSTLAEQAGKTFGALGNAFAAYGLSKSISGGYSVGGKGTLDKIGAIASFIPEVGPLAGIVTGAINRLFGKKLADQGIEATLGGAAGFEGSTTQFFKGGLLSSNKTTKEALSADIANPLAQSAKAIRDQVSAYASALNLPVDAIASFTESIKFSTKDLSPEQIQAKLSETLKGFGDKLADTLSSQVDPFKKAGESTSDALARLGESLKSVNPIIGQLGFKLFDIGTAGADAASKLADLFGGAGGFEQAASGFYQKFYSETERAKKLTEQVTSTLAGVGVALPDTREQFRSIVEAQDLTTDSGRKTFAALLGVADAFDQLETAAGDVGKTALESAAELTKLQEGLAGAIKANIGKFQTPEQRTRTAFEGIAGDLKTVGVSVDVSALIGATKDEIYQFAESFVAAADNSLEAKTAVVNAAGALADLKDAADAAEKSTKEAADALATQLAQRLGDAISGNIDKFLSPQEQISRKANVVAGNLSAVGVNFSAEQLLGYTRAQIFDYAKSFVLATENSTEAKIAIVEAAGALADLKDAADSLAADGLQAQLDEITKTFGDLSVINDPIKTLSQSFVENRDAARSLQASLDEMLGKSAKTIQQTLGDLLSAQKALQGFRGGLQSSIEDARLRALSPAQRVASLRTTERSLFGQLSTASDPVAVAQRLQGVILQRIKEEAQIEADLSVKARDAQISTLKSQIDGFERLKQLADSIAQFTGSLRFSDISPLSFEAQLLSAKDLFDKTLTGATAGDASAQGNLTGNAQAYLDEARKYYGSSAAYNDIFQKVTGSLDALGSSAALADPQVAYLQSQLDAIDALSKTTVDTSAQEVAALTALDSALASREAANQAAIDKQVVLAQQQVDTLKELAEDAKAQLVQQAAIAADLKAQIDDLRAGVARLVSNSNETVDAGG